MLQKASRLQATFRRTMDYDPGCTAPTIALLVNIPQIDYTRYVHHILFLPAWNRHHGVVSVADLPQLTQLTVLSA